MKIKLNKIFFSNRKKLLVNIMRTFIFLFCSTIFAFTPNNILSQNAKIVIEKDKTLTIDEVFDLIKYQTDYTFIYQEDLFKNAPKIYLNKGIIKANKLLEKSLAYGDFNFSFSDSKTIILEKTPEKASSLLQQKITGLITDKNGMPLPGVNVFVKGTNKGVTSDFEGNYAIVVSSNDVLVFSYIGYVTQEVSTSNKTKINIVLQEDVAELREVIVTAIGTQIFVDESGSTSSIVKSEDVTRSGEAGMINALAGKASGVRIGKSNGDPGSGSSIQIRGANTISGASQPLIILDGIPVSNDNIGDVTESQQSRLDDINAKDIKSVQVLKGASAAALWGSRAANGVIVITTNNGSLGKKPSVQYSFTQSYDEISVRTRLQDQYGQGRGGVWQISRAESWGDKIADRLGGADVVNESGQYFISNTGNLIYPVTKKNSQETFVDSNFDQVFQTGVYSQHNISISGGGEQSSYFFSYENLAQEGIVKNFDYKRQNLRLNTQTQLTDWLKWSNRIAYTNTNSNRIHQAGETTNGVLLGLLRTSPDFDITDYIGTYVAANGDVFPNRQRSYRKHFGESENPVYNNPLWTINEQKSPNEINRFIINPELTIDPVNWLKVILRGGLDYYSDSRGSFFPVGSASGNRSAGLWTQSDIANRELNFDGIAIITKKINTDVEATATLGFNLNDRQRVFNTNTVSPFAVNATLPTPDLNPDQSATSWNRTITNIRSNRGYGVLGFNLFDQLFVNLSGALEAASTIKGNYFYPSADMAWQFSDLIESETLSFGKLRVAWGKVGIQPAPYKFSTLATTGYATFGGSFLVDSEKGNANLKPEIKTEWEVGTDLRFFKSRISLGLTYYENETKDILFAVNTNPSSGYTTKYSNAAVIENKGFEIDLNGKIIDSQDFKVSLNANFNNNKNLVVDIAGAETVDIGGTSKAVKGFPMSSFWLPGSLRNEDGSLALDARGFPQLDTDRRVLGDPNPDWRGGLGMNLNWKGLDFSFLFEHSQGGEYINRTNVVLYGFGNHVNVAKEVTLTEDLTNIAGTVFPAGTTVRGNVEDFGAGNVLLDEKYYNGIGGGLGFNKLNDFFIEDATWTKLRNVTLGYTFNGLKVSSKLSLESLRVSVTGRDLILLTNVTDVDPETNNYGVSNASGMNYFNNPGTRSILFNLQVNF